MEIENKKLIMNIRHSEHQRCEESLRRSFPFALLRVRMTKQRYLSSLYIGLMLCAFILFNLKVSEALNIEAVLDSTDGSSVFAVQDSATAEVLHIDSDGNVNAKGCMRIDLGGAECVDAEGLIVDGTIGIGVTTASTKLHINSGGADTVAVVTLANTGGDYQTFINNATPEAEITGNKGDLCVDHTNGNLYIKTTDGGNTGWVLLATASSANLQGSYGFDADGSDVTIALTSADDSLIFQNPAAAGTDSTFLLRLDQDTTGVIALDIDAENTTANVVDIQPTVLTTGTALDIGDADALTTGKIANFASNSATTDTRTLVAVTNSATASIGVTALTVTQESKGKGIFIDANGNASTALDIDSEATTSNVVDIQPTVLTTGTALDIGDADALTTGKIVNFASNSATTDTRTLVQITNDNSAAVGVTVLKIQQDSSGAALTTTNGNVGIGYTAPGGALVVNGSVGVGNSAPSTNLHVTGGGRITGLVSCDTIDTDANGVLSCGTDANGAGSIALQTAYNQDADGGDATIALTTADDSLILQNPAAGGTDSAFLLRLDQDVATGIVALDIDAENTTANVVDIQPTVLTTGTALDIGDADALTTGKIANFVSNSATTDTRTLVQITNDNSAAVGTTALNIQQDAAGYALITTNGNVGIGYTAPSATLTINGNVGIGTSTAAEANLLVSANTNANSMTLGSTTGIAFAVAKTVLGDSGYGLYFGRSGNGYSWIQAGRTSSATAYDLMLQSSGGNVAIGTTAPVARLDVTTSDTTQTELNVTANSLTTGSLASFNSTSADTATRTLFTISSSSTANSGSTLLSLTQNGGASTGIGLTYGGKTGTGISATGNSLTTGTLASFTSTAASTATRILMQITNDDSGAVGTTALKIQQDADARAIDVTNGLVHLGSAGLLLPSSTSLPAACSVGQIYMDTDATTGQRIFACETANNWVLEGGSGASTLQAAYGGDVDGSDVTIALTTADDSIILQNPAAAGTDSAFLLRLDQDVATGIVALDIDGENTTSNVVDIQPTVLTTGTALDIGDANALTTGKIANFASDSATTDTRILVQITNDNSAAVGVTALRIQQDSSGPALTTTSGNVGIGTTAPDTNFMVQESNTDTTPTVEIEQLSTGDAALQLTIPGDSYAIGIDNSDSDKFKISYSSTSGSAVLGTNDRLTIDANGNVGIGTTGPTNTLVVGTTSADNRVEVQNNSNFAFGAKNGAGTHVWIGATTAGNFQFSDDAGNPLVTFLKAGNVGIGYTAPGGALAVNGSVGIGNSAPSTNLHVTGGARITGLISCDTIDTDANGVLSCGTDTGGSATLQGAYNSDVDGSNTIISLTSADDAFVIQNDDGTNDSGFAMQIDQNDTAGVIAFDIDAENTDADIINVSAAPLTTATALDIGDANALTTGKIANFASNSATTNTRTLVQISNDNSASIGVTVLGIQQNADATAIQVLYGGTTGGGPQAGIDIQGNSLTTGTLATFTSTSASTATRNLVTMSNSSTASVGATTLSVQQSSGANGVFIDQNGNGVALNIDSEATTTNGIDLQPTVMTTGTALDIGDANALTTGKIANFASNSANTEGRHLVTISNDNSAGAGAIALGITQSANQKSLVITHGAQTSAGLTVTANSLTTAKIASFSSSSASTATRTLIQMTNSDSASVGTTILGIDQQSAGNAISVNNGLVHLGTAGLLLPSSANLPATCSVGQIYMDTDATTGQRIFACETADNWVLQGGSGGASTLQAAYDGDANGSNTIISLTANDDAFVIQNDNATNDSGFAMQIDQNDTAGMIAFDIDAENTDADIINVSAAPLTTATALDIGDADALTSGKIANFASNATSTANTRTLVQVTNSATATSNVTALGITQESNGKGLFIDANGSASVSLDIDSEALTSNVVDIQPTVLTTGTALDIGDADALTSGKIANFASNATSTANTRTLVQVTNSATATSNVTALGITQESNGKGLFIDANGSASVSLDIDSEALTSNVVDIQPTVLTTGTALDIGDANALTTGKIANFVSNSATTDTRTLVQITQDNSAATFATALKIQQDSNAPGLEVDGPVVGTPTITQSITAVGGITAKKTLVRIAGSGGAVDISANPQIADGTDGQILILQGDDDTNTVKLEDATGLQLDDGVSFTMGKGDTITLIYDSGDDLWMEVSRKNN